MSTNSKGPKGKEILEDPEAIIEKLKDSEEFFQKNKKIIYIAVSVILVAAAGFVFWQYQKSQQNEAAQTEMYNAVFAWEKDSLKLALEGDQKNVIGLNDISEDYSGTDAGNMAKFYSGTALLKQGNFDEAIEKLDGFSSNDLLLQGYVYSLIGDAYMEKKEFDNAAKYYAKASNYKPNKGFTPNYLMKLALAHEQQKEYSNAVDAYERIIKEYPSSRNYNDAKKYKARAEGLAAAE